MSAANLCHIYTSRREHARETGLAVDGLDSFIDILGQLAAPEVGLCRLRVDVGVLMGVLDQDEVDAQPVIRADRGGSQKSPVGGEPAVVRAQQSRQWKTMN